MINHAIFLLEGMFMFFINHDQAEIGIRQKQRGPCPDHKLCRSIGHRPPCVTPPRLSDFGMPKGRLNTESVTEPLQPLRRKGDFRQQDHHLFPAFQRGADRLEINLGLARPGHTIKQRDRETIFRHLGTQHIRRTFLRIRQMRARDIKVGGFKR